MEEGYDDGCVIENELIAGDHRAFSCAFPW